VEFPPSFGKARALSIYQAHSDPDKSVLASMIRRHKYGLDQAMGRALAECLGELSSMAEERYDVVVPVPLHRTRLRWRGFNQTALLAAEVAHRLNCRLDTTSLIRAVATLPQSANDFEARRRNVRRAFAVRRAHRIADQRVLLVDDVMTTGATANECARTLRTAGAHSVDVFTLARVL
jgi:ComF family protein